MKSNFQFPDRLTVDSSENLEQNRLDYYLNKPSSTIYDNLNQSRDYVIETLINNQNKLMLEIMPKIKLQYQNKTINLSLEYYKKLIQEIVCYINYLFQQKKLYRVDPIVQVDNTDKIITIKFDIVVTLVDKLKKVEPFLYRYRIFLAINKYPNQIGLIQLVDWVKKPNLLLNRYKMDNKLDNIYKKCRKDTDCPYYKSNQNYPNNFGGCDKKTGRCQFPIGIKPLTFILPKNPQQAKCGNCRIEDGGECCIKQLNRSLYPKLASPDYRFTNDINERKKYKNILDSRNLDFI